MNDADIIHTRRKQMQNRITNVRQYNNENENDAGKTSKIKMENVRTTLFPPPLSLSNIHTTHKSKNNVILERNLSVE